jgi:hypothetical protein
MNIGVNQFLAAHSSFTTAEFMEMLRGENPDIGRSTVYYLLKKLSDGKQITKIGRGHYTVTEKKNYAYELSQTAKDISALVQSEFPLVEYQIWELYQLNEFVNHQLSRNTIFVEVESMQDESVFNRLFELYPHVLLNPDIDEYYRYAGEETVVVQKLISESPPPYGGFRQAALEKLLVDLFSKSLTGSLISKSEYRAIYEDCFRKYRINQTKLLRYARRRKVEQSILDYIRDRTEITLEAAT